jgi:polysaccharide biosynthesis/export protein
MSAYGSRDISRGPIWQGSFRAVPVAAALLLLTACASRGGDIPYNVRDFGAPDPRSWDQSDYHPHLGPMDVVRINVFRVPDLSAEYQVDHAGFVDLPLVGRVTVRGQNTAQFAQTLERLYGERYLNNPEITVRLVSTTSNNIIVDGGVKEAGVFTLAGPTTLLGAVATAGGVDPADGNPRRVAIFRKRGGQTVAAAFDLIDIRRGKMVDPPVYPGDTVIVDSSTVKPVFRDLLQALPVVAIFSNL